MRCSRFGCVNPRITGSLHCRTHEIKTIPQPDGDNGSSIVTAILAEELLNDIFSSTSSDTPSADTSSGSDFSGFGGGDSGGGGAGGDY